MRDLALSAIVALLLLIALRHPVVGAYTYTWISMMSPHKLTYGFAFDLPFAQFSAIVTMVGVLLTRRRQAVPMTGIVVVLLLLLGWMTVTSFSAYAPTDRVIERWIFVVKIQLMLFVTWMLITDAKQLRVLIWVVTLSVCFFGIKGGVWTVLTGGGGRVWGPPGGMLQGNNELAVALVVLMPMLYYLRETTPHRWVRHLLLFCMVACAFSILGSQSRGALLALAAMAFFLGLKGKHPVRTSVLVLVLVVGVIAFMPENWSSRMGTIRTYQDDTSAMSRIWTWITLWNAAVDHPLTGVGFMADNQAVFQRYAPLDGQWHIFAGAVYVAHSIYFQILGEHGFVGLGLFLLLWLTTWVSANRVSRRAREHVEFANWMPLLMRMVQVSLVGYGAGGAFLSLGYLDLPYYIMGFVVLCQALLRRQGAVTPAAAALPQRSAPAYVQAAPRGPGR